MVSNELVRHTPTASGPIPPRLSCPERAPAPRCSALPSFPSSRSCSTQAKSYSWPCPAVAARRTQLAYLLAYPAVLNASVAPSHLRTKIALLFKPHLLGLKTAPRAKGVANDKKQLQGLAKKDCAARGVLGTKLPSGSCPEPGQVPPSPTWGVRTSASTALRRVGRAPARQLATHLWPCHASANAKQHNWVHQPRSYLRVRRCGRLPQPECVRDAREALSTSRLSSRKCTCSCKDARATHLGCYQQHSASVCLCVKSGAVRYGKSAQLSS